MKNLKKISRDGLKSVLGGTGIPTCRVGYIYICNAVGICDETSDIYECICGCIPIKQIP